MVGSGSEQLSFSQIDVGDEVAAWRIPVHPNTGEDWMERASHMVTGTVVKLPGDAEKRESTDFWVRPKDGPVYIVPGREYVDNSVIHHDRDPDLPQRARSRALLCRVAFYAAELGSAQIEG